MEPTELISQEWSSLSGLYTAEESDFMNQLLGNSSFSQHLYQNSNLGTETAFWPPHDSTIVTATKNSNNSNFAAQVPNLFPTTSCYNNPVTSFDYISMGISIDHSKFTPCTTQSHEQVLANKNLQARKREREILVSGPEEDKTTSTENSGKRSRNSNEVTNTRPVNLLNISLTTVFYFFFPSVCDIHFLFQHSLWFGF